jgi:hypothetical protein
MKLLTRFFLPWVLVALLLVGITYAATSGFRLISIGGMDFASFFSSGSTMGIEADSFHERTNDTWLAHPLDGENYIGGDTNFGSVGSTTGVSITSGGRSQVFIWTNAGTADLTVSGTVVANTYFFNTGGTTPPPSGWDSNFSWAFVGNNIVNQNSGNVGINNSVPSYKLDVNGSFNVGTGTNFTVTNGLFSYKPSWIACTSGQLLSWNGSAWACASDTVGLSGGSLTSNYLPKWNGSSLVNSRLYEDPSTGKIGIGTGITSPSSTLTVKGTTPGRHTAKFEWNNGYGVALGGMQILTWSIDTLYGSITGYSGASVGYTDLILNLWWGNVGIGTDIPAEALDVEWSIRAAGTIYVGTMKHPATGDICIGNTCP